MYLSLAAFCGSPSSIAAAPVSDHSITTRYHYTDRYVITLLSRWSHLLRFLVLSSEGIGVLGGGEQAAVASVSVGKCVVVCAPVVGLMCLSLLAISLYRV